MNFIDSKFYVYSDILAGISISGARAIAGPIVACCYALGISELEKTPIAGELSNVDDISKIPSWRRDKLSEQMIKSAQFLGIGIVEANLINAIGEKKATALAVSKAISKASSLKIMIHDSYLDPKLFGRKKSDTVMMSLKDASNNSYLCACASIIARTHRDHIMISLDELYPGYNFKKNAGFPNNEHHEALDKYGIIPNVHRTNSWPFIGNSRKGNEGITDTRRRNWREITFMKIKKEVLGGL